MVIKVEPGDLFVFDLDDTLYNEIDYLKSAYREIAARLDPDSWKFLYAEMISLYRQGENVFKMLSDRFSITLPELLEHYRNHYPDIRPFPGVLATFEALREAGARIMVLTDGRSVTQRNKLKALGILPYLEKILISEETGHEKPDPHNYLLATQQSTPPKSYYIGDNFRKDFKVPNDLGWITIGIIDNGLNIHAANNLYLSSALKPQFLILSMTDLQITKTNR